MEEYVLTPELGMLTKDLDDHRGLRERIQEHALTSNLTASRLTDELQRRQQLQDQVRSFTSRRPSSKRVYVSITREEWSCIDFLK